MSDASDADGCQPSAGGASDLDGGCGPIPPATVSDSSDGALQCEPDDSAGTLTYRGFFDYPDAAEGGSPCITVAANVPTLGNSRGDCGPHPPADLRLRNGDYDASSAWSNVVGPSVLWCSSPTDIWATDISISGWAGSGATKLMHWDGTCWATLLDPGGAGSVRLESAWGSAPNDVWIVGHNGGASWYHRIFLLHWDGARLRALTVPDTGYFDRWQEAVWGTGNDLWIASTDQGEEPLHVALPVPPECLSN
jgi:hypothetical protein